MSKEQGETFTALWKMTFKPLNGLNCKQSGCHELATTPLGYCWYCSWIPFAKYPTPIKEKDGE